MADGILTVDLVRDGQATAWGFRLQGGHDVGLPLTVQRVFLGSPSEGELHRGDVILMIGNKKTDKMSHLEASEMFRKAGNNLKLVVQRSMRAGRSGSITPTQNFSTIPLSPLGGSQTMYHFVASPPSAGSTPPPPLTKPNDYVFRPLPTTQFTDTYRSQTPDYYPGVPEESQEYVAEKTHERQSIVSQPHRTFPLITPHAKPRHDLPTGSYLRFVQDPNWKTTSPSTASKINEALMLQKLQDTVLSTASSSVSSCSPGRTPTPDSAAFGGGPKIVHKQYNSPVNLYSAEAVTEALVGQASIQHSNNPSGQKQSLPTPLIYTASDIKRSPTYRMIHNEEWSELKKGEMREHNAVENKVYTVPPFGDGKFGQDVIHQSSSFKNLMINISQTTL